MKDAQTKGGTLESGTSEKAKFNATPPVEDVTKSDQKPKPNPAQKVGGGMTIK